MSRARVLNLTRACGIVKIELKYQLLFDSSFLFRLVRRVTNAPIVVSVNTAVALRWSFCLLKIGLRSFYLSTFGALQASRTKLRKFKQQGFYERWKDDRKWNNHISVSWGKEARSSEMEGRQHRKGTESCLIKSVERGNQGGMTVYSITLRKIVAE